VEDSKPAAMCEFFREAEKASTARGVYKKFPSGNLLVGESSRGH